MLNKIYKSSRLTCFDKEFGNLLQIMKEKCGGTGSGKWVSLVLRIDSVVTWIFV